MILLLSRQFKKIYFRYGIVLKELSLYTEATEILLKAVEKEPLLWATWKELASICKTREAVSYCFLTSHD